MFKIVLVCCRMLPIGTYLGTEVLHNSCHVNRGTSSYPVFEERACSHEAQHSADREYDTCSLSLRPACGPFWLGYFSSRHPGWDGFHYLNCVTTFYDRNQLYVIVHLQQIWFTPIHHNWLINKLLLHTIKSSSKAWSIMNGRKDLQLSTSSHNYKYIYKNFKIWIKF